MIKNHLLSIIMNNSKSSRCKFLSLMNMVINSPNNKSCKFSSVNANSSENISSSQISAVNSNKTTIKNLEINNLNDDIKYRFRLFTMILKNGNYCKNLDPDLTSI